MSALNYVRCLFAISFYIQYVPLDRTILNSLYALCIEWKIAYKCIPCILLICTAPA